MVQTRLLGERYQLSDVLGRGGMAEVRLGHDVRLGRTVAVKTLRSDLALDSTFQARFRREAQSAASLNHPSIVAVYDTGEDYSDGVPVPYIVMEYVEGSTLRDLLLSGRKLMPERALEITAGVLQALAYSHQNGIIHRDIKPGNVMLTRTGSVKVMDFGIARAIADTSATMTATAAVIGTAQYLSPEQARGEKVDARSDLYSTGCLLYELLTGRPPFTGDSPVSIAYQHVRENPIPPSQLNPEITPAMDAIVLKALAKNPDNRYQNADEMREDIERCLDGRPVTAPPVLAGEPTQRLYQPTAGSTVLLPPTTATQPPVRRRRRGGYILLLLGLLALLIGGVVLGRMLLTSGGGAGKVTVPDLTGLTRQAAETQLTDKGLALGNVTQEFNDNVDPGKVIRQNPEADATVDRNTKVDLVLSQGSEKVAVPDVVGDSVDDAKKKLEDEKLSFGKTIQRNSDRPKNEVIATSPDVGTAVATGTQVDLIVSNGVQQVEIPNVVGQSQAVAEAALRQAGFRVVVTHDVTQDAPAGTVTRQIPDAGSKVDEGSRVSIIVAQSPPSEPTPTNTPTSVPPTTGSSSPTTPSAGG